MSTITIEELEEIVNDKNMGIAIPVFFDNDWEYVYLDKQDLLRTLKADDAKKVHINRASTQILFLSTKEIVE